MEQGVQLSILVGGLVLSPMNSGKNQIRHMVSNISQFSFLRRDHVFWIDFTGDQLYRSHFSGSQLTVLVNSGIECSGNMISYVCTPTMLML